MSRFLIVSLALWSYSTFALAYDVPAGAFQSAAAADGVSPRAHLSLLSEESAAEKGDTFAVGVSIVLEPEWHVYWTNAGGGAMATEMSIRANGKELITTWPTPHSFSTADGMFNTFGYEHEVLIEAKLTATGIPIELSATIDFLVCKVDCIPDRVELKRTITVGQVSADDDTRGAFGRFRSQHPTKVKHQFVDDKTLKLSATSKPEKLEYFPYETGDAPEIVTNVFADGTLTLRFEEAPGSGVLAMRSDDSYKGMLIEQKVDAKQVAKVPPEKTKTTQDSKSDAGLMTMLLFALLGGLLLNLMPCVLPVLLLKVTMLSNNSDESQSHAQHALSFVLGCVLTMAGIGAVVLLLRSAGTSVGWGFQLQEPAFLLALMAVLVAFALNLFGVYEFRSVGGGLGSQVDKQSGWLRPALEGMLTVVLATPCSAPLVGTALGFAMLGPPLHLILILATMGLGLAIPTALLLLLPGLRKRVPKPGPWQETLKTLLGFSLLGVCAWLLFILAGVKGQTALLLAMGALLTLAAAIAVRHTRWLALLMLVCSMALGYQVFVQPEPSKAIATEGWIAFTPQAVQEQVRAGKIVFVDYTADWCVTCKVNESQVLESDTIKAAFTDHKVTKFVADWTKRDEVIRASLAEHNRAAVPMYLVYGPKHQGALRLPELLTEKIVINALKKVSSDPHTTP